jgi:tail tube protein
MVAGNVGDLAFALQTTKGTASAASQHRIYLTGGAVAAERDFADLEETSGSRLRTGGYISQARAGGSPAAYVRPNWIGLALYGALGAKAVVGAADPYTHTFTPALTQPWLTFWRMLGGALYERFVDCKISRLVLRSAAGGALTAELGVVGLNAQSKTTAETAATVELTPTFMHADGKGIFLVENVAVSSIESITVTIETGVELQQGDAIGAYDAAEGLLNITVETVQAVTDFSLWNRVHYGSASPADNAPMTPNVIELAATGIDFGWAKRQADGTALVTPERSLHVTATRLQIQPPSGIEPNTTGDPLKQTVTYRVYEPAAGAAFSAILKNSKTTYPAN